MTMTSSRFEANKARREKYLNEIYEIMRKYISMWRMYPDLFIDFVLLPTQGKGRFRLFVFQRMMLRAMFRYRYTYWTLTRGSSKSFTVFLGLILKCILFPGVKLFFTAPVKAQAIDIAKQSIDDIFEFLPILKKEIKESTNNKDDFELVLKNSSRLVLFTLGDSTRGQRSHGGAYEEIASKDMEHNRKQDAINSVIVPTMAGNRSTGFGGKIDPNEVSKSQVFLTTATDEDNYGFAVWHTNIANFMAEGKSAFLFGADYRLGTELGNLDKEFIEEQKEVLPPLTFRREYLSKWSKTSEGRLVSYKQINKLRVLNKAELGNVAKSEGEFYVLSYDVAYTSGADSAESALVVARCKRRGKKFMTNVVNIELFEGMGHREQARMLKQKMRLYNASMLVIDVNGYGHSVAEDLMDPDLDSYPPYSPVNDERGSFKAFETFGAEPKMFVVSTNWKHTPASEIHDVFVLKTIDEEYRLLQSVSDIYLTSEFRQLSDEEKKAFFNTDYLEEQLLNLKKVTKNGKTSVEQIRRSTPKDIFSALEYLLFYIRQLEVGVRIESNTNTDAFKMIRTVRKPRIR